MAGSYPDPIGPRLAYDEDGSQLFAANGGFTEIYGEATSVQIKRLNSETEDGQNLGAPFDEADGYVLIFPTPRNLVGGVAFSRLAWAKLTDFQTSVDTTNGIDGTWDAYTNLASLTLQAHPYKTGMRNEVVSAAASGVRALRFKVGENFSWACLLHLYGQPAVTDTRLVFWHPTLDQSLSSTPAHLDWGNRPRATEATKQVRVKNTGGALTASAIEVGVEALTDATPALVTQHQLSLDGTTFASTVAIAELGPGEISDPITVKQTLSGAAALGLWTQRLYATAGAWA